MKWLKITHFVLIILFLGGILSSFAINISLDLTRFDDVSMTYRNLAVVSNNIVKYGAQGTILLGLTYGFFTTWGFFKHRWLTVKWILFTIQTIVGITIVDSLLVTNLELLNAQGALALSNPTFVYNHYLRLAVIVFQIVVTLATIVISVYKPWRSRPRVAEKPAGRPTQELSDLAAS